MNSTAGTYNEGASVSVLAQPSLDYRFTNWSNGSTVNPLNIKVSRNLNIQANFTKNTFPLALIINVEGRIEKEAKS